MWRAGLFVGIGGCLWISAGDHDERLDAVEFAIDGLTLDPAGASACSGPDAVIPATVALNVGSGSFTVRYSVDGDEPTEVGTLPAEDGLLSFAVEIVGWTAISGCAGGCQLPLEVTVGRAGLESTVDGVIDLVPPLVPELLDVELGAPSGVRQPLAEAPTNPDGAYDVASWPNLYFGLRDRHFSLGLGGRAAIWYCPGTATPDSAPGSCVFSPVAPIPQVVDGEQVFVGPTEFLGLRVCDESGLSDDWHLFGRIEDHACGGPYTFPLSPDPVLFVLDDCDHDGVPAGEDCNDLDPTQNPTATEICDRVDNDCDGNTMIDAATIPHSDGPPENFTSLQQALDAAEPRDEVWVCPGSYTGPFQIRRDVTVVGSGADGTTVLTTASAGSSVLTITDGPTVVIRGVSVTGATGVSVGAGIDGRGAASLTVEDCDIHDNQAIRGGGVAAAPLTTLRRTTVRANTATEGGGIAMDPGCEVHLEGATVEGNGGTEGAGIHSYTVVDEAAGTSEGAVLTLDAESTVVGNLAVYRGGGLYAVGDLDVSGGSFVGNDAPGGGGGMMFWALPDDPAPSDWTVRDTTIDGNTGTIGAGIAVYGTAPSTFALAASTVQFNVAGDLGGGVMLSAGAADAIQCDLTDVLFENNEAVVRGGGLVVDFATARVDGGHLDWNTADDGAAVSIVAGDLTIGANAPTDIEFNEAATRAGGIAVNGGGQVGFLGGRISGNTAVTGGGIGASDGIAVIGGSLEANFDVAGAAGLILSGQSSVRILPGAVLTGNDGSEVRDSSAIEACSGAVVDDILGQGVDADCFTITPGGYVDGCGC